MHASLTAEDEGKPVIDANGDRLGTVSSVDPGGATVEPAGDLGPTVLLALDWARRSAPYPLRESAVRAVTESGVYLRCNL